MRKTSGSHKRDIPVESEIQSKHAALGTDHFKIRTMCLLLVLVVALTVIPVLPVSAQMKTSQTVTLNFVGDILLASRIQELIDAEGAMAPWIGVKNLLLRRRFHHRQS